MDPIDMLKTQHGHLEDLFHELTLAKEAPTAAKILAELASELVSHIALEDRLLRRALSRAPREVGLWDDWEGRLRIERVTIALGALEPGAETFSAKVASLQDLFEDRIEYEETRLFPKLERFLGQRAAREVPSMRAGATSSEPNVAMGAEP